jgi:predicted RNase H-like HicB family nuclease
MSSDRGYRVLVVYDREKERFEARVPELELEASGSTRQEALTSIEDAIEQRIAGAAEDKASLPEPIDVLTSGGEITVKLGDAVYRDLLIHARQSGLSAEELAGQMLARSLGAMEGARPQRRRPPPEAPTEDLERGPPRDHRDERERERDDRDDRGRGRGRRREGYRPELDDKANFLEYLRGLEKGGGPQGGGGRGRR